MQVIQAADAPRFEMPGVEFAVFAAPSLGSAGLCAWRLTVDAGHRTDAPHTLDRDEIFTVLSGSVQITPDSEKLGPGDSAIVPAGEPIALLNVGEGKAELIVAITAGFTGYMADGTTVQPPWSR